MAFNMPSHYEQPATAQTDCEEADDCDCFVVSSIHVVLQNTLIADMICCDFDASKSSS